MRAVREETWRVVKKQRLCAQNIDNKLDELLREVEFTKAQLVEKQVEYRRKRSRVGSEAGTPETNSAGGQVTPSVQIQRSPDDNFSSTAATNEVSAGEEDDQEMDQIVRDFIKRVRLLNTEKQVANEFKSFHQLLSKYVKLIDKTFCNDITRICWDLEMDQKLICQLVAEYLYQDGQIEAADAFCKEANLSFSKKFRTCFVELHDMLRALRDKDIAPALKWARKHRRELRNLQIDLEFELVKLNYLNTLEQSPNVMDAVKYASEELSCFHDTHAKDVGRLLSCVLFKDRLPASPYKDLFHSRRWEDAREALVRACCRLRRVPHRPYLQTCLVAGVPALPAIRKLVSVMDNSVNEWTKMEELPVEIPIEEQYRFHSVFCCPVSKEESTPENPPMLLKCGHVICKSCVKKISSNFTRRRFKCPTCPMEQLESETRELFF